MSRPPRNRMVWAGLLAIASCCAQAQDGRTTAVAGQVADVATTAAGLALGAAEANPLGLLTLGAKAIAYQQIEQAPATEQPALWSAYGAFGWGAAANNVCVITAIATGGAAAALCPLVGLVAGLTAYQGDEEHRTRATFDAICEQARTTNPALECIYTPPAQHTRNTP